MSLELESQRPWWREMPALEKALSVLLAVAVVVGSVLRFSRVFAPWSAQTDWKQWIWQYWRYAEDGAFPPGHIITDYAFAMQPPLYHGMMRVLVPLTSPMVAANLVSIAAWILAVVGIFWALRRRAGLSWALLGCFLFVHDQSMWAFSVGGYPRSFGVTLTALFLAAWLNQRHRLVLLVLVLAGAIYPSVVITCGLAYGLWIMGTAPRTSLLAWLKPVLAVVVAGAISLALALVQDIGTPEWWGSMVWQADAGVELTKAGRSAWIPQPAYWPKVWSYVVEPFKPVGLLKVAGVVPWLPRGVVGAIVFVGLGAMALVATLRGKAPAIREVLLAFVCALVGFGLARALAFKLYLPHRVVQHTLPVLVVVLVPLVAQAWVRSLSSTPMSFDGASVWNRVTRNGRGLLLVVVGFIALSGDGMYGSKPFRSYAERAPLYEWFQANTAPTDEVAGFVEVLDEIPFFAGRQVYANWKMAHAWRPGFFKVIADRTVEMYGAMYATSLTDVVAFADKTGVRWFVVDVDRFDRLEKGDSQISEPMRSEVARRFFEPNRITGFVLATPAPSFVAFSLGSLRVLDVQKMRLAVTADTSETAKEDDGVSQGAGDAPAVVDE